MYVCNKPCGYNFLEEYPDGELTDLNSCHLHRLWSYKISTLEVWNQMMCSSISPNLAALSTFDKWLADHDGNDTGRDQHEAAANAYAAEMLQWRATVRDLRILMSAFSATKLHAVWYWGVLRQRCGSDLTVGLHIAQWIMATERVVAYKVCLHTNK